MSNVHDTAIRNGLTELVISAYGGTIRTIHHGPPKLPKGTSDLPYVAIYLADMSASIEGIRAQVQTYRYEITYVGRAPSNQILEERKAALANALITRLLGTGVGLSVGRRRLPITVDFSPALETDWEEPVFSFTVSVPIEVSENY